MPTTSQTILGKRRAESPIPQPPAKRPVLVEPLRTSSQTHKQYAIAPEAAEDDFNIDYEATNAAFLELWSAVVAEHVYPELPREACSKIGNAVLVLCMALGDSFFEDAVKQDVVCEPLHQPKCNFDGQAKYQANDRDENETELVKQAQNDMEEQEEAAERRDIDFMGFKLTLRDNLVFLSDTMTPINKQTTVDTRFDSQKDLKSMSAWYKLAIASTPLFKSNPNVLDAKALELYKIFSPQTDNYWNTRLQVSWKRMGEVMMSYESLHQKVEQQVDPKHWLSWQTCLQIGNAVMVLYITSGDDFFELDRSKEVSKPADQDGDESKVTSDERRRLRLQSIEVNIMGFSLMLRNNSVFLNNEIISPRQPSFTFDSEQDKFSMIKWYEYAINAIFKNDTELLNSGALDLFRCLLPPKRERDKYWETRHHVCSSNMANTLGTL
ncbi:hypothetical protein D6C92_05166 [Aureobasidium pullulans]|nr:hypothetical protein D6C92_05166 [Aureobasidium pullulans]